MKDKKIESGKNENENKNKQTGKKLNNEGLGKVSGGANPAFETNCKIDPNIPPLCSLQFSQTER